MALLVFLHQTISRQSAAVAQIGLIALAVFFFWAINNVIDEWRLSHPLKSTEYDEEYLYHSDGKVNLTISLGSIQSAVTVAGPAYRSRKNLQVEYVDENTTVKLLHLSIAAEDVPGFEEFCSRVVIKNASFIWQDEG